MTYKGIKMAFFSLVIYWLSISYKGMKLDEIESILT